MNLRSIAEFLTRFLNFFANREKEPKILVLVDWENIVLNAGFVTGRRPLLQDRLDNCVKAVAAEIGGIIDVFIFMPPHAVYPLGATLHEKGFFIIACPKVRDKTGEEKDTTDETLMRFGGTMMDNLKGLTHICLASGDKDFSPLLNRAQRKGLGTVIIASSLKSLAGDIIPLASQRPDGSRMVHILYDE